jgi:hypothetical protein
VRLLREHGAGTGGMGHDVDEGGGDGRWWPLPRPHHRFSPVCGRLVQHDVPHADETHQWEHQTGHHGNARPSSALPGHSAPSASPGPEAAQDVGHHGTTPMDTRARRRDRVPPTAPSPVPPSADAPGAAHVVEAPHRSRVDRVRFWVNLALILAFVAVLLAQLARLPVVFVLAFVLALLATARAFERHGSNVVLVTTMISAAGVFTGVSAAPA